MESALADLKAAVIWEEEDTWKAGEQAIRDLFKQQQALLENNEIANEELEAEIKQRPSLGEVREMLRQAILRQPPGGGVHRNIDAILKEHSYE